MIANMNIVFMGTPDFALASLEALYNAGHNILAIVSQPDKKVGRGMKVANTPTKEFALLHNIPIFQPEKIKNNIEFIEELKKLNADVFVVVAYGKILPELVLQIPKYGSINVHGSLLPKYRGAAPIQWSIIKGEKVTGITTMYMDKGMDTGDMLLKSEIPILEDDNYGTLYEKLKIEGAKLIVKTLDDLKLNLLKPQKQGEDFTIAPMIFKEDCEIDFNKSAKEINDLVRGVNPVPGAFAKIDDNIYKIWKTKVILEEEFKNNFIDSENEILNDYYSGKIIPGTVLISSDKKGLYVLAGKDIISILEIQGPNAKKMSINDYLRGKEIKVGSLFKK